MAGVEPELAASTRQRLLADPGVAVTTAGSPWCPTAPARRSRARYSGQSPNQHLWMLKAYLDEEDGGALAETRKVG